MAPLTILRSKLMYAIVQELESRSSDVHQILVTKTLVSTKQLNKGLNEFLRSCMHCCINSKTLFSAKQPNLRHII